MVHAMTYLMHRAFIASLGLLALVFAPSETFARSAGTHGGASAHRSVAHLRHHHRAHRLETFLPAIGDTFYQPLNGEPPVDFTQSAPRNSYAYDAPWDWAHRYPPVVTAPELRPYVPDCHAQTVTVPGEDGGQRAVNILRCY
jgi:hypothetical protein